MIGWDKTFSLNHIQDEGFEEIHFFGDKVSPGCFCVATKLTRQTYMGGNDYEIYEDKRTIGHTVTSPEDTAKLLDELFFSKA
jgi:phosphomannomutase